MKLYANHTIHRRSPDDGPSALPQVIEAGSVFDGTKEELETFRDLQRKGGAGATVAAREATPGEVADAEAKRTGMEDTVMTINDGDGMRAAATTSDVNTKAKTDFERSVEAEKAKGTGSAASGTSKTGKGKSDDI